jgi:Glycosyl transferase family 2
MTGQRLHGTDIEVAHTFAKNPVQSARFRNVVQAGRGSVGIDRIDVVRLQVRVFQGGTHHPLNHLTRISAAAAATTPANRPTASVSIVMPCYNGHHTLPYVLQTVRNQLYRNFELVLVDDGSTPPIAPELLLQHADGLNLKLVRSAVNLRYCAVRNVGIQCAEGDALVLMDDDMLAPETVTFAAALRHQHLEKMIFLAFREDTEWAAFTSAESSRPALERDWRWLTEIKPDHVPLAAFQAEQRNGPVRITEESRFLKNLGFGAAVGFWDLPTLMCSHGLSMTRQDVIEAGGFVEQGQMNHWGTDDLSFGATMIAYGVKVAPALEWQCWHLRQEGRETSRADQFAGFLSRWPHYISYLDRHWPAQRFPRRPIRLVSRQGNLQEFEVA